MSLVNVLKKFWPRLRIVYTRLNSLPKTLFQVVVHVVCLYQKVCERARMPENESMVDHLNQWVVFSLVLIFVVTDCPLGKRCFVVELYCRAVIGYVNAY